VLPRTTEAMSETGLALRKSELEPGDLVFFDTRRKPFSHVGIYIGQQRFIHAPASGGAVQLVDMRERYWRTRYVGARRVVF
jgi:cell wall-associated NlpC family hydrolase